MHKNELVKTTVGSLTIFENRILGIGSNHTRVHMGEDQDHRKLAIKIVPLGLATNIEKELDVLKKLEHPNVIGYFFREKDDQNMYLALKYC